MMNKEASDIWIQIDLEDGQSTFVNYPQDQAARYLQEFRRKYRGRAYYVTIIKQDDLDAMMEKFHQEGKDAGYAEAMQRMAQDDNTIQAVADDSRS